MTIGTELRGARERLGLSREQISAATKVQLDKIAALEKDAFDQLPPGIYLEGMAAAYAREVGLNADAFLRRLRAQVAPPPPVTLEEIAAARQSREPDLAGLQFGIAHGMAVFAIVALVLAALSIGVHFYPLESLLEQEQSVAVAEPAATIPAAPTDAIPERFFPREVATTGIAGAPAAPVATNVNVAGAWRVETFVESSSLKKFEGLRLGYRLVLRQEGDRVDGTGYKVSENGVSLTGGGQTPIALRGTIDEGRLKLAFGERGTRRDSKGMFDLVVEDPGVLGGRFKSDAARSAGIVKGRRL